MGADPRLFKDHITAAAGLACRLIGLACRLSASLFAEPDGFARLTVAIHQAKAHL
jgi:hypothetical protein